MSTICKTIPTCVRDSALWRLAGSLVPRSRSPECGLGVFQYLTILALSVYSVDRTVALAYSLLLYAVALLPKLLVGGVMLGVAMKNGLLEPGFWAKLRGRA